MIKPFKHTVYHTKEENAMRITCPRCNRTLDADDEVYYSIDPKTRRRTPIGCEFCTGTGYADELFNFEDDSEYTAADRYNDLMRERRAIAG